MHDRNPSPADPRVSRLMAAFPDLGDDPAADDPAQAGRARASVALVLRTGDELEVLLIRRAETHGDPWSGHMALPGGRWAPEDDSLLRTAVRETLEETGVRLDGDTTILGQLDPLIPATRRLPPISIFPFVFAVPGGTEAAVASPEVDETLWTPLSTFLDPDAAGTVDIVLGDGIRHFPCFRVEERVVWGLTYRILQDFLGKLRTGYPEILAAPPGVSAD
jgi:8-oxo-dGTP pyrophosphatase MutT (NUDIX family)